MLAAPNQTTWSYDLPSSKNFFANIRNVFNPNDPQFQDIDQVPDVFLQAWPYLLVLIVIENVVLWLEGKPTIRLNDGITSLSHGLFLECGRLLFRGAEHFTYIYIYENYRLADLPWHSPWTWYIALIGVDFCYYWVHRACHEVSILWAQHQVHHSSEDYNLTVGLRQSLIQNLCGSVFYLPMALCVPPAHYLAHQQLNLLSQVWLHTNMFDTLGPLEWILNTPKHHRVHHGCNLYCLDKNYGGFLIIWDRMFGTFAEERKGEEIVYGLVYNQPSFNPLYLQVFYTVKIWNRCKSMESWKDKFGAIWKGPSWIPGKPRLGADEDKLDIRHREKFDVKLPLWCNIYLLIHFILIVFGFQELAARHMGMTQLAVLGFVAYVLASLTIIGMMFENNPNAGVLELIRCLMFLWYLQSSQSTTHTTIAPFLQLFFLLSACFWMMHTFHLLQVKVKEKTS